MVDFQGKTMLHVAANSRKINAIHVGENPEVRILAPKPSTISHSMIPIDNDIEEIPANAKVHKRIKIWNLFCLYLCILAGTEHLTVSL